MTRKTRRINDLNLNGEQREALGQFQKDYQKAAPHMAQLAATAKAMHQNMIDAPFWRIMETPQPDGVEEPAQWTVGHAQVNYVDHIEHEGTQDK